MGQAWGLPPRGSPIGRQLKAHCLLYPASHDLHPNTHLPTMAPAGGKDDPEQGIELEPLLGSSLDSDGNVSDRQSARSVITRSWRRLFLRISVCAALSFVALVLLLTRPREWHPSGPTVS